MGEAIHLPRLSALSVCIEHCYEPLVFGPHLGPELKEISWAAGNGFVVQLPEHVLDALLWR